MVKRYFAQNANLIGWRNSVSAAAIQPWKPVALQHDQWPPDYRGVYAWRLRQLALLRADPALFASAWAYYSTRPAEFIMHWMDTYDPRRDGQKWIPFVFFVRQAEYIQFLHECFRDSENGLVEKARDMGATWLSCAYTVWRWIFVDNEAIGWGSRKQELVDRLGITDSIFEKMRLIIRRLPSIWHPDGFSERDHMPFMRILNPENGSTVVGETGDNIGRGGRTKGYMKDESAHYQHPELIAAALDDNTKVQIDISSVNGLGNVFHRKREAGIDWQPGAANLKPGFTRVFVFDWREHPDKTQAWYDMRKAKAEREGMQHVFAQEVDRNYSAAIANTIIPYDWLVVCIDAHKKIRWIDERGNLRIGKSDDEIANNWMAGLDVADGGIDRNAIALRQSIVWRECDEWGERDVGVTTRRVVQRCRSIKGIKVQYDTIGVGSAVKSEYNRLIDTGDLVAGELPFVAWNAGAGVVDPYYHVIPDDDESILNGDFFKNMKAQAWWSVRTRVYKTMKNITEGVIYPFDELISFDSRMVLLYQVLKELAQVTRGEDTSLRMVINKKPDGTKSPNLGDAGVMAYFPVNDDATFQIGSYGT